jgi:hypothetical protein
MTFVENNLVKTVMASTKQKLNKSCDVIKAACGTKND